MDWLALATAVFFYGAGMRGDAAREFVAPRTVRPRHEVESVQLLGGQHRADRGQTGVRDRAGRQTRMAVGVVRIIAVQVGAMNNAAIPVVQQRGVNSGGV